MNIQLRRASESDLQTIVGILNDGTRSKLRRGDLAWGMTDHDPEKVRAMVAQGIFYLAYSGETPVGVCAVAWQDPGIWGVQPPQAGYIQRFAVKGVMNGMSIGSRMLDLMLEEVAKTGRQYLRLAVPSGNTKLRTYYENHGFTRADAKVRPPTYPSYPPHTTNVLRKIRPSKHRMYLIAEVSSRK